MKSLGKKKESTIQSSFFTWLGVAEKKYRPYCFAIPNGGSRHLLEAVNLKRQGVTAGVPDVFCAIPRKGCHGLFIEFKAGKNKLTNTQWEMIERLGKEGYQCGICYDLESAIKEFSEYVYE